MGFFDGTSGAADDRGAAAARGRADAQRLMAIGLIARAIVRAVRETGLLVEGEPQLEFELLVSVEDRAPYAVTHRQVVPRALLASLGRPGASIPVRVDPAEPRRVLIG